MSLQSTIVQLLTQTSTGQMLFESFESPSWSSDEGWSILAGNPNPTNLFAFDGNWSLPNDTTYWQILKDFAGVGYKIATVYFYDDLTIGTALPFAQFITPGGLTVGLGVDCSVNTGTYAYINVSGVHADTGQARTVGWHRFQYAYGTSGFNLEVDGNIVYGHLAPAATKMQLGAITGSTGTPFGYWDDIQVSSDQTLTFPSIVTAATGAQVFFYDQDWNQMGSGAGKINLGTSANYPLYGRIMITLADGVTPAYYSPLQYFWGGDVYAQLTYDFQRRPEKFEPPTDINREDVYSTGGIRQSTFFYAMEKLKLTWSYLTAAQKNTWLAFWSVISQGGPFGLALFKYNVFMTALSNGANYPATPGNTQVQFIAVAGINPGSILVLRNANGGSRETHIVAAINGNLVTFAEPIVGGFVDGDQVTAQYYYPAARTTDKKANLTQASTTGSARWNITLGIEETLGGNI